MAQCVSQYINMTTCKQWRWSGETRGLHSLEFSRFNDVHTHTIRRHQCSSIAWSGCSIGQLEWIRWLLVLLLLHRCNDNIEIGIWSDAPKPLAARLLQLLAPYNNSEPHQREEGFDSDGNWTSGGSWRHGLPEWVPRMARRERA